MAISIAGVVGDFTWSTTSVTIPAISGYVPQLGDVVLLFGNGNSQSTNVVPPSDWLDGPSPAYAQSTTNMGFCIAHKITQAEVTAGTNTWTVTCFDAANGGRGAAVVIRGGHPTMPVDAAGIQANATAGNMPMPSGITPRYGGGLILAFGACDNLGNSIGGPGTGWTNVSVRQNTAGQTSYRLASRDAVSAAGVPIDVSGIAWSVGASDESVTVLVVAAPVPGGFFAMF